MCDPVTGTAVALGMGTAVVGAAQSVVSYNASVADYYGKSAAWSQNVVNAEAAGRDEQTSLLTQQLQEQDKFVQKEQLSGIEEAQKSSSAEVSAVGAGVSGVSVDNVLNDIAGKSELNRTYMDTNYRYVVADTSAKLNATNDELASRIASVQRPTAPDQTSELLGIAGAGIKGGSVYMSGTKGGAGSGSQGD